MADRPDTDKQETTAAEVLAGLGGIRADALALQRRLDGDLRALPAGGPPKDVLQAFASVDAAAKAADAIAKRLKDHREGMNDRVLDALEQMGLQRAPLTGGPTIYRARELWAGNDLEDAEEGASTDEAYGRACDALEAAGLGQYVQRRYNVQSLSGYFRDRERELEAEARERDGLGPNDPVAIDPEDLLPEELRGVVKISEVVKAKAKTS